MIHKINKEDFLKSGIYLILNIINNKVYIGSTKCFRERYAQHKSKLKGNKHACTHLQNSYNKYGKDNFEFKIIEVSEELLNREEFYIKKYNSCNNEYGYNLTKTPTQPKLSEISKKKISKTLKDKYEKGILKPTSGSFKKGITPWNKGKTYEEGTTECMKVPKTITDDLKQAWENSKKRGRDRANFIYVYNLNHELLYISNSLSDLEEYSKTEECNLPLKTKGNNILYLEAVCKAHKSGKPYKGLYFKSISKPLS